MDLEIRGGWSQLLESVGSSRQGQALEGEGKVDAWHHSGHELGWAVCPQLAPRLGENSHVKILSDGSRHPRSLN